MPRLTAGLKDEHGNIREVSGTTVQEIAAQATTDQGGYAHVFDLDACETVGWILGPGRHLLEEVAFESAKEVTAIGVRLHPLDVGFDLRSAGCVVALPEDAELRVSYPDKLGFTCQ